MKILVVRTLGPCAHLDSYNHHQLPVHLDFLASQSLVFVCHAQSMNGLFQQQVPFRRSTSGTLALGSTLQRSRSTTPAAPTPLLRPVSLSHILPQDIGPLRGNMQQAGSEFDFEHYQEVSPSLSHEVT